MKTIIPTALLLVTSFFLQANNPIDSFAAIDNCRETEVYDNLDLSVSTKVTFDLNNGVWIRDHQTGEAATVYQFRESGLLEIIRPDAAGKPIYESYMWRVEEFNNQPFLVLTTNDFTRELLYQTLPTCQGMVLINPVSVDQISLKFGKRMTSIANKKLVGQLTGNWQNATYPFDLTNSFEDCGAFEPIEGAYLEYEFRTDGTFTKKYGSNLMELSTEGFYEVFGTGEYILFHVSDGNGNYHQHVAKVRYLDYGELVLEQALESEDFADFFCSQLKSITFVQ